MLTVAHRRALAVLTGLVMSCCLVALQAGDAQAATASSSHAAAVAFASPFAVTTGARTGTTRGAVTAGARYDLAGIFAAIKAAVKKAIKRLDQIIKRAKRRKIQRETRREAAAAVRRIAAASASSAAYRTGAGPTAHAAIDIGIDFGDVKKFGKKVLKKAVKIAPKAMKFIPQGKLATCIWGAGVGAIGTKINDGSAKELLVGAATGCLGTLAIK
jgi:hypothetical protein